MMAAEVTLTNRFLLALDDPEATRLGRTGAKAATLARLSQAGFDVPDGIVLDASAFHLAVDRVREPSADAIRRVQMPRGIEQAVIQAAAILGDHDVVVRSSALDEDSAHASFAGQYESVLGVRGPEAIVSAVRECWASAFGPRVNAYRNDNAEDLGMAVLIQRQIAADVAGVAFSADPVTGDRDVVVIDAVVGLGDRLMSGEVTPERWRIAGDNSARHSADSSVLSDKQAGRIAHLVKRLESFLDRPQDVEWAIEAGKLWLLQARPITSLPAESVEPIPVAVDIPDGYWERDASHWPAPHSPLSRSIVYPLANDVTPRMCAEYGMLADRIELTDIGGWHYTRTVPIGGKDRRPPPGLVLGVVARLHPVLRRRIKTAIEAVRSEKGRRVIDRWWEDWQPSLMGRARELSAVDVASLDDPELLAHYERTIALLADGLESHLFVIGAVVTETYPMVRIARDLPGWDDMRALGLVTGLSTWSSQPARELARLGRLAGASAGVTELLDRVGAETHGLLAETDAAFLTAFEDFRWTHATGMLSRDVADPTLADRPEVLLRMLANQLASGFNPSDVDDENRRQRDDLLAEARSLIAEGDRDRFEELLARAARAYPVREDNVFVALQTPGGIIRSAALEMGRRLAERGQIDEIDEVFFLEDAELREALKGGDDRRDLVGRRKGEKAWVMAHPGPLTHGKDPGPPPSMRFLPAEVRDTTQALFWMMGANIDPGSLQGASGQIRGVAASPGTYTGPVRVVMGEHQFDKIREGDVVVCPVTQPTWSVLFPSLGAVVTDSGGVLSHPAIIAREYRIPAVVATAHGTDLLHDGQIVTVDGSAGTVTVLNTSTLDRPE